MTLTGVLNVYKEKDMTSFDVIGILRKVSGQKRIGHTGTLDPMARGVLPVCFGRATRISDYISEQGKEYLALMRFGIKTDTLDREGKVIDEFNPPTFSLEEVNAAMDQFRGTTLQEPPMYSAVKVKGKKLYDYARQGVEVVRKARPIQIDLLEALSLEGHFLRFRCQCSKGTYIRKLAEDLANELGTIGTLWVLERVRVGPFTADQAISIDRLKGMNQMDLLSLLTPMEDALPHFPSIHLKGDEARGAAYGQSIAWQEEWNSNEEIIHHDLYKVFTEKGFLGLGMKENDGLKMKKVLADFKG